MPEQPYKLVASSQCSHSPLCCRQNHAAGIVIPESRKAALYGHWMCYHDPSEKEAEDSEDEGNIDDDD
jgi:hypothetical protein